TSKPTPVKNQEPLKIRRTNRSLSKDPRQQKNIHQPKPPPRFLS
ncbi:hypothetical protein GWI33_022404, partial [Rhynchophorus ferrugineus]